jgi:hypothetical protein
MKRCVNTALAVFAIMIFVLVEIFTLPLPWIGSRLNGIHSQKLEEQEVHEDTEDSVWRKKHLP